ncbi:hypothetical protein RCL1_004949 [Eukaryota sp. TZLM3-RCL]
MSVLLGCDLAQLPSLVQTYLDKCILSGPTVDFEEKLSYADFRFHVLKAIPSLLASKQNYTNTDKLTNLWNILRLTTVHSLSESASKAASLKPQKEKLTNTSCIRLPDTFLASQCSKPGSKRTSSSSDGPHTSPFKHSSALCSAWSTFILIDLPSSILLPLLVLLPRTLTAMSSPLKFSDFLLNAVSFGDSSSLLSVHSLYLLMRDHGLDCPNFFDLLLNLLNNSLFTSPFSKPFQKSLPIFLSSPKISSEIIKKFAKKLASLCLTAPPHFVLWALSLIYDLLTRHPTTVKLIHQSRPVKKSLLDSCVLGPKLSKTVVLNTLEPNIEEKYFSEEEEIEGEDDLIDEVSEPAKIVENDSEIVETTRNDVDVTTCQINQSQEISQDHDVITDTCHESLWELSLLCSHYHPFVSSLARAFKSVLEPRKYLPENFADANFDKLIENELNRKYKNLKVVESISNNFFNNNCFDFWNLPEPAARPEKVLGSLPDSVLY